MVISGDRKSQGVVMVAINGDDVDTWENSKTLNLTEKEFESTGLRQEYLDLMKLLDLSVPT